MGADLLLCFYAQCWHEVVGRHYCPCFLVVVHLDIAHNHLNIISVVIWEAFFSEVDPEKGLVLGLAVILDLLPPIPPRWVVRWEVNAKVQIL